MRDGYNMCASDALRSFICMEGASGGGGFFGVQMSYAIVGCFSRKKVLQILEGASQLTS